MPQYLPMPPPGREGPTVEDNAAKLKMLLETSTISPAGDAMVYPYFISFLKFASPEGMLDEFGKAETLQHSICNTRVPRTLIEVVHSLLLPGVDVEHDDEIIRSGPSVLLSSVWQDVQKGFVIADLVSDVQLHDKHPRETVTVAYSGTEKMMGNEITWNDIERSLPSECRLPSSGTRYLAWCTHRSPAVTDFDIQADVARLRLGSWESYLNAKAVFELQVHLRGLVIESSFRYGRTIFVKIQNTSSGVETWSGVRGAIMLTKKRGEEILSTTPIKKDFLQQLLVSEFLLKYCGQLACSAQIFDADAQKRATKALKGIRVAIANNKSCSNNIFTIQGLGPSPQSVKDMLGSLIGGVTVSDLKYSDMPCVNLGTEASPCFFPSEMCKILPRQTFKGAPVLYESSQKFNRIETDHTKNSCKEKLVPRVDEAPRAFMGSFLPTEENPDEFDFLFLEVDTTTSSTQLANSPGAWNIFKRCLTEHWDRDLGRWVHESHKSVMIKPSDQNALLMAADNLVRPSIQAEGTGPSRTPGSRKVLFVAMPNCIETKCIDALKVFCDTSLGVQLHIVAARDLNMHFNPLNGQKMAAFASEQIVKMVARAGISKLDFHSNKMRKVRKPYLARPHELLVGVHVVCLASFMNRITYKRKSVNLKPLYLVSIVKTDPHLGGFESYSEVVCVTEKDRHERCGLASDIGRIIAYSFFEDAYDRVSVISSGLSDSDAGKLVEVIHAMTDQIKGVKHSHYCLDYARIVVASMTEQKNIAVEDDEIIPLTDAQHHLRHWKPRKSTPELQKELRNDFDLQERTLSKYFTRSPGEAKQQTWYAKYAQRINQPDLVEAIGAPKTSTTGIPFDDEEQHYFLEASFVECRPMPDILFLAQQLSKRDRTRLHVYGDDVERDFTGSDITAKCPVSVEHVHHDLWKTLYFL